LLKTPISRTVVLAGACLLALTPFFWWGNASGHDFEFHMFSWMEVLGQWKHGIVYPRWAALSHWGYGEARFLFYPPASWTLGAALGAILPWKLVPGAYCWIVLTLSGASMYRLAREWLAPSDALFAAVFYALNPYHLLIVYWRSAYAELLAAVLLPLLLLCLLKLKEPGIRPTLYLSLVLAAAWLTNAPAAVMLHYSTAAMALVLATLAFTRQRSWAPEVWRPLGSVALAILLGGGLAAFYLLPAIYEQRWVDISQVLSPGIRPQENFLFTTIADADHDHFNLFVSCVALAEICALMLAIGFARKRRNHAGSAASADRSGWWLLSAWGIGSAALMLSVSNALWQHLPKLRFVQLPFRWLLCLNAAFALLLTMAVKRWTSRLLVSAVLLATLITAGYRIQNPWWDTDADITELSDAVTDGTGYEGTDEYVPAGVDAYELKQDLPLVSDDTGAMVPNKILAWTVTERHLAVHTAAPEDITVRLLNYPAWEVVVNGTPTQVRSTEVTGLIVIPIAAGDNDIQIHFRRTMDRLVGNLVSLLSLCVLIAAWFMPKAKPPVRPNP
jgi:hypothetical protein